MLSLLKEPFFLIPTLIAVALCIASFIYPGWVFVIAAVLAVLVTAWAKKQGSDAFGAVPILVVAWAAAIFSGIVLLARIFS